MDDFEKYGVKPGDDWSADVFVRVFADHDPDLDRTLREHRSLGYLLEYDHRFEIENPGKRAFWKIFSEHSEAGECPLQTALRGIRGESGLVLREDAFTHVRTRPGFNREHYKVLFTADIPQSELKLIHDYDPEHEGEEVRFFSDEEFFQLVRSGKFLRSHYDDLIVNTLVLPFGRDLKVGGTATA